MAQAKLLAAVGVLLLLYGVKCIHWTTDNMDGLTVHVCEGQDLTLPWDITTDPSEQIIAITWFFHENSDQIIAIYSHDIFLPTPPYSQRVQRVFSAGIVLKHVTLEDNGNYTIEVNATGAGGAHVTYPYTATVRVSTASTARTDAALEVRQEPTAVYDNQTGEFQIQLTCTSQGRQPPTIIWTLPSGESRVVSTAENGHFPLLVPNPVSGGNYTCRVHDDSPAAQCLPSNSPAPQGRSLYLDAVTARLSLLEARDQDLQAKYQDLQAKYQDLQARDQDLEARYQALQADIRQLQAGSIQPKDMANTRVAFHARLSCTPKCQIQLSGGQRLVLDYVPYNQGGGYNRSTGVFTAPHSGTYVFLATLRPNDSSHNAAVYVKAYGNTVNYCKPYNKGDASACNLVFHVTAGQSVWLESYGDSCFHTTGTAFSGFLLSPDP